MMARIFGANWKTTVSMIGGLIFAALTWLSNISYDQGPIALVIPIKYKSTVTLVAGIASLLLFAWNGIRQKDREVTGGSKKQDLCGRTVPDSVHAGLVQTTA